MQAGTVRYIFLASLLLAAAGGYMFQAAPRGVGDARWPEDDGFYALDHWSVGPQRVELVNGAQFVTRVFQHSGEAPATLTIVTSREPKVYGAGAEVPFLGNGYSVQPAPAEVFAGVHGVGGLIARGSSDQWLVMYAYGERRGLLGNGPLAWTLAAVDGVLGWPNDYYRLYLIRRIDVLDQASARGMVELADTMFSRVARWYRS